MKKKAVAFIIILSIGLSNLTFEFAGANSYMPVASKSGFVVVTQTHMVKVVHSPFQGEVTPRAGRSVNRQVCAFETGSGMLQGSVLGNLFVKPAACFKVNFVRLQTVQNTLYVAKQPVFVPRIVVFNFKQIIQNQFAIPQIPSRESSGNLPLPAIGLLFFVLFVIKHLASNKSRDAQKSNNFSILIRLQILRC